MTVLREARRNRFEIGDFPGRTAAGHSVPPRRVRRGASGYLYMGENGPARMCIAPKNGIFLARLRDVDERSVSPIELSSDAAPAALIRRLRS
jgi:hypothetical protein